MRTRFAAQGAQDCEMPDRTTALTNHLAPLECDFQKRLTWDDPGDSGANVDTRNDVSTEGTPQLQIAGEPAEEEIVWCREPPGGLATGERYRQRKRNSIGMWWVSDRRLRVSGGHTWHSAMSKRHRGYLRHLAHRSSKEAQKRDHESRPGGGEAKNREAASDSTRLLQKSAALSFVFAAIHRSNWREPPCGSASPTVSLTHTPP